MPGSNNEVSDRNDDRNYQEVAGNYQWKTFLYLVAIPTGILQ